MNFRSAISQLGILLLVVSAAILVVAAWSGLQALWGDATEATAFKAMACAAAAASAL